MESTESDSDFNGTRDQGTCYADLCHSPPGQLVLIDVLGGRTAGYRPESVQCPGRNKWSRGATETARASESTEAGAAAVAGAAEP